VGRITHLPSGRRRHFINIADAGLGGLVVEQIRQRGIPIGGTMTYLTAALRCLFMQRRWFMEMRWGGGVLNGDFIAIAVANGSFFGGGMHVAVGATPHDGTFRVVAVESQGWLGLLGLIPLLYQGTIHLHPRVRCFDTASLEIHARSHTPMGVDGEPGFDLPARLEILPGVLQFHGA
jgi:diacylglycerol kinase family enzyme